MTRLKKYICLALALLVLGLAGYWIFLQNVFANPFYRIPGIDILPGAHYSGILELRGEPNAIRVVPIPGGDSIYYHVLHYDGVIFYVFDYDVGAFSGGRIAHFYIIGEAYRLGGFGFRRIGVGSTRRQVMADYRLRRRAYITKQFPFGCRCSVGLIRSGSYIYPNFWYSSWDSYSVFFEFENNIVTRIRVMWWI